MPETSPQPLTDKQRVCRDVLEFHHDLGRAAAYQLVRTLSDEEVAHVVSIETDATRAIQAVLDFAAQRRQKEAAAAVRAEAAQGVAVADGHEAA